jgi:hypothetical protein
MGSDLTSLTPRHPQPHVDPDLPSGRQHGYSDVVRQREIATDAVRAGALDELDDLWADDLWKRLPAALQARLRRGCRAMERRPYDERAALVYRGRVAEAVAYLGSDEQVAR